MVEDAAKVRGLSKRVGSPVAVDDVSFTVRKGKACSPWRKAYHLGIRPAFPVGEPSTNHTRQTGFRPDFQPSIGHPDHV